MNTYLTFARTGEIAARAASATRVIDETMMDNG